MGGYKKSKVLFLVTQKLSKGNGITKKFLSQKKALEKNGLDVELSYFDEIDGKYVIKIENEVVGQYGRKSKLTTLRLISSFKPILGYIIKNQINAIYFRYAHTGNPFMISFFSELKKRNIKIYMEIPTYPYDAEYINVPVTQNIQQKIEKISRKFFYKYVSNIITFTSEEQIFGIPTINISNGIDFDQIKMVDFSEKKINTLTFIGVAQISFWHGYDRMIDGLKDYYKKNPVIDVVFNIVGDGNLKYVESLKEKVKDYELENKVFFLGKLENEELDRQFNQSDLAIGCLACHRKGIEAVKSLKNVEYAARGIPFIYSEINSDFDNKPYILKVPADDSPIDIESLTEFLFSRTESASSIRDSIKDLSWSNQMKLISDAILTK